MIHYSNDFPNNTKRSITEIFSSATIQFGQTVYGGSVDFLTGVLTVDKAIVNPKDCSVDKNIESTGDYLYYLKGFPKTPNFVNAELWSCTHAKNATTINKPSIFSPSSYYNVCYINFGDAIGTNTIAGFKQYCEDNNVELCYPLATPFTIKLTPQELKLLQGINNITTNGTTITLGYQPDNSIGDAIKASEEYTDRRMDALGDLAYIDEDGDNSTKFLRGDGTWQNTPAGVTTLADLTDTNISSPSNGQVLKYNGSKWVNSADYSLPTASAGTLGGVKVGANLSIDSNGVLSATGGGGANTLNDLTDVSAASPQNKQVLAYDSSQSKWVAVDADVVAIPRSYWSSTTRELEFMITVPAYNTQRILKFSLMHNAGLAASEYMLVLDRGSVYSSKLAGDTCAISSSYLSSTNTYTITISMPSVSGGQNFVFAMTMYNGSGKTW